MADPIVVACPECKKQMKAPAEAAGKKVRCKSCSHIFAVQAPAAGKPVAKPKPPAAAPPPPPVELPPLKEPKKPLGIAIMGNDILPDAKVMDLALRAIVKMNLITQQTRDECDCVPLKVSGGEDLLEFERLAREEVTKKFATSSQEHYNRWQATEDDEEGKRLMLKIREDDVQFIPHKDLPGGAILVALVYQQLGYGITYTNETARCPACAYEMESAEAVICLHCGYNTQTRQAIQTIRAIATTKQEVSAWLLPGILCVVGAILLACTIVFLWVGLIPLGERNKDEWWAIFIGKATQVWGSVFCAAGIWFMGQFAVKRLIKNPMPPEKLKKK